ncbi:MAG: peptide-methionine (S)-S-oxide reductase MsrA [Bacteroidales bacterium]|nr:peptide-methionine (S)-S-oxide reductase MsrA [Bacteroidales bacterium]
MMKTIYFAGGCFWGTEHYLSQFDGVTETAVGYANGSVPNPAYELVYTDQTGHVECVKVVYDDEMISLATLCRLFFRSIDPLLLNRQGGDIGTRYRTGIYWTDIEDQAVIEGVYSEIQQQYNEPLAVEKSPLTCFYPAEEYHQKYLIKNPEGYCHLSISTLKSAAAYSKIIKELRVHSDDEKKTVLPRFFKTGKGEYGEGDKFLGVIVPNTRKVAKTFKESSYKVIEMLLESEWHECRLCALLMLIEKYRQEPEQVVTFYLKHTKGINNWDLVDLSAPYILGDYLKEKADRMILHKLAASPVIWEQRIAVVSTLMLIRHGQFEDTLKLAELLIDSRHDLMRKSIGWMLREVGKRDEEQLVRFLEKHKHEMPRTMLRYAIEKFPEPKRREFMRNR